VQDPNKDREMQAKRVKDLLKNEASMVATLRSTAYRDEMKRYYRQVWLISDI
jgi:hypothetical protein